MNPQERFDSSPFSFLEVDGHLERGVVQHTVRISRVLILHHHQHVSVKHDDDHEDNVDDDDGDDDTNCDHVGYRKARTDLTYMALEVNISPVFN